jgi:hypothetical protein
MKKVNLSLMVILLGSLVSCKPEQTVKWENQWECEVFPPEHQVVNDSSTGTRLVFATTSAAKDLNFYFDLNCWTGDLSLLAFTSERTGRRELFGYLAQTGEIVRLQPADQSPAVNATVDYQTHDLYCVRNDTAYQWHLDINLAKSAEERSRVTISERPITSAPPGTSFFMGFTQSADRKYLSAGLLYKGSDKQDIISIDIHGGEIQTLYTGKRLSHVQYNKYNKNLLRFSDSPQRMWYIDIREPGAAHKLHLQEPGELVTHEDWWVNDQMTFCGAYRKEESHVKIIDLATQTTRIIGAGSWWPDKSPKELAEYNWWHASGSQDGRWVAADNWHGHIAIMDSRTSHLRLLTRNHRKYGDVTIEHPHVGWAPDSKSVEFTSHKYGNADVCIAYLPDEWNDPFIKE